MMQHNYVWVSILYVVQEHAFRIELSDVPRGDAEVGVLGLILFWMRVFWDVGRFCWDSSGLVWREPWSSGECFIGGRGSSLFFFYFFQHSLQ